MLTCHLTRFLQYFLCLFTYYSFGYSPPSDTRDEDHDYTSEIYDALDEEWRRHNRVKRTFSPLGFKKGKLPRDVFASMGAFYYNNQYNKVLEEWGGKGVFVNWWETEIYFIQIPWGLKDIWQKSKSLRTHMFTIKKKCETVSPRSVIDEIVVSAYFD